MAVHCHCEGLEWGPPAFYLLDRGWAQLCWWEYLGTGVLWADEGYRKRSKTLVLESASYQSWGGLGHVWQKGQWNCP